MPFTGFPYSLPFPLGIIPSAGSPSGPSSGPFVQIIPNPSESYSKVFQWLNLVFPQSWINLALVQNTPTAALFAGIAEAVASGPGDQVIPPPGDPPPSEVQLQMRLKTMTGNSLDLAAKDFYGDQLPRNRGETDTSYLQRILNGLFKQLAITRPNIFTLLVLLTGQNPHLVDPDNPNDVGGWSAANNSDIALGTPSVFSRLKPLSSTGGTAPPSFVGIDNGIARLRWSNPNGTVGRNPGYAYQVFLITTYPTGFGAQGNAIPGGYVTVRGSNPPTEYGGTITVGSPSVYTNLSGGGGFIKTGGISIGADGRSYYAVTGGNARIAFFQPNGLTSFDLTNGRAQLLRALDRARAEGFTYHVAFLPAESLAGYDYTT